MFIKLPVFPLHFDFRYVFDFFFFVDYKNWEYVFILSHTVVLESDELESLLSLTSLIPLSRLSWASRYHNISSYNLIFRKVLGDGSRIQ